MYFAAFLGAALAIVLLSAPNAQHRLLWRRQAKDAQLRLATRIALVGTVFIALAVASVVFLTTNLLYGTTLPAVVTAGVVALTGWLWYGWLLLLRLRAGDRTDPAHPQEPAPGQPERRVS